MCQFVARGHAHHQVETERDEESTRAVRLEVRNDIEASRSQDDGSSDPKTTVGAERRGTERVSNSHFPCKRSVSRHGALQAKILTTFQQEAGIDRHRRKQHQ